MKNKIIDELEPFLIYNDVDESKLKAEIELLDRFIAFSNELLRLSLLGLSVIGFLYKFVFLNSSNNTNLSLTKFFSGISALFFALSAALALLHKYFATDGLRYYIYGLRCISSNIESSVELTKLNLIKRKKKVKNCLFYKSTSAVLLSLGALMVAIAFITTIY